jgi:hypothetical protein
MWLQINVFRVISLMSMSKYPYTVVSAAVVDRTLVRKDDL